MRELVGAVQERVQILIRPGAAARAPVRRILPTLGADVAIARAGVVDAHPVVREAAQALIHWLPGRLTVQIPQGDVHRRRRAHFHARTREAEIAGLQGAGMAIHLLRRLAQQQWCDRLVDVGLDGTRAEKGFA